MTHTMIRGAHAAPTVPHRSWNWNRNLHLAASGVALGAAWAPWQAPGLSIAMTLAVMVAGIGVPVLVLALPSLATRATGSPRFNQTWVASTRCLVAATLTLWLTLSLMILVPDLTASHASNEAGDGFDTILVVLGAVAVVLTMIGLTRFPWRSAWYRSVTYVVAAGLLTWYALWFAQMAFN